MKKLAATFLLLFCFSVAFAGSSVVHNPQNDTQIGKSKKDEPILGCTCFFHQIEEYVKALF